MKTPWVALVGPEIEENLSLRQLAALLEQAQLPCDILSFNSEHDFLRIKQSVLDAETAPILIGLSLAFQWRAQDFLALASCLREEGYRGHITCGGHFATFAANELLQTFDELDSVCLFEADYTVVELVQALVQGRALTEVPGLLCRHQSALFQTQARPAPDLATLPPPDRRGEPALCFGHHIAPMIGSRGCYGNCSFCCIAAWQEQLSPQQRYRERPVEAIADEMVALQRQRGVEIFVFQDDNFLQPSRRKNLQRVQALVEALRRRGIGRFATVLKARPNDVDPELFELLVHQLNCIRLYVGIETDSDQGLQTLQRRASSQHNRQAIETVRALNLYICFNLLIFDPDTTLAAIEENIRFMQVVSDYPFSIGRVELYAGTPLLQRMLAEDRCRGDWMQWDYRLGDTQVERVFKMTMTCLRQRHFGYNSALEQMWLLRFDIEACRFFHSDLYQSQWLDEGVEITKLMSLDTIATLSQIVAHVRANSSAQADSDFALARAEVCRATDQRVMQRAQQLALTMGHVVGHPASLTEVKHSNSQRIA